MSQLGGAMGSLDFKSEIPKEHEDELVVKYNSRIGAFLFVIYVAAYAGFMALSSFFPERMGGEILFGLNLSVSYGFFLIVLALVLAVIYMKLCKKTGNGGQQS